jgi:hypothetical protein
MIHYRLSYRLLFLCCMPHQNLAFQDNKKPTHKLIQQKLVSSRAGRSVHARVAVRTAVKLERQKKVPTNGRTTQLATQFRFCVGGLATSRFSNVRT